MTGPSPGNQVLGERIIAAPARRVYEAWLDPDLVRRWMAPGAYDAARVAIDRRVGGAYRVGRVDGDGVDQGGFEAEIVETVPDERLVWRGGFVGPERTDGRVFDSRLTVTLEAVGAGATKLTLRHELLDALHAALPDVADKVQGGWEHVAGELDSLLTGD